MERHFLDNLINNSNSYRADKIELLKYELGSLIHHYGDHFSGSKEQKKWIIFDNIIRDIVEYSFIRLFNKHPSLSCKKRILSSAVSNWNDNIRKSNFCVENPPWAVRRDLKIGFSLKLYLMSKNITRKLRYSNFNYLISDEFFKIIDNYYLIFKIFCETNSYDALIISQYNSFFEKIAINIFKGLNKPVLFWHHGGIPANYNKEHQERADYFILMGEKQINDYVKMGYDQSKFIAAGHPIYNEKPVNFKFGVSNILVITKAVAGYNPLETLSSEHRENSLLYLYSVQRVLEKHGVKKVVLRCHPSENHEWYSKYIDTSFFIVDTKELSSSINDSTLVIGPISTTIIDSLYHGVNYVVYEPIINNKTIIGTSVTPPLDGTDFRFPVAHSEDELEKFLLERKTIDISFYGELVKTPRDISFLDKLI
jgi:hypothetical protein